MPDPVKIKIEGDASSAVAASKEATSAIKEVGQATTESARATELATQQQKSGTEATVDATRKTAGLTVKKQELKQIVRELGREFPQLGLLGRLALNPLVAAFATVAIIIGKVRAEYQLLQSVLGKTADLTGLKSAISGVKDAIVKSREEAEAFIAALDKSNSKLTGGADEAIDALEKQSARVRELMQAEKELALAKLKNDLAIGKIDETTFKQKSGIVESSFAKADRERLDKLDADKVNALYKRASEAEFSKRMAQEKFPGAVEAANLAENHSQRIRENIKTSRENLRKQNEHVAGLQDEANKLMSPEEQEYLRKFKSVADLNAREQFTGIGPRSSLADVSGRIELLHKIQTERQKANAMGTQLRELEPQAEPAQLKANQLRASADDLKNQIKQLSDETKNLEERIQKAKKEMPAEAGHRRRIGELQDRIRGEESGIGSGPQPARGRFGPQPTQTTSRPPAPQARVSPQSAAAPTPPAGESAKLGESMAKYNSEIKSLFAALSNQVNSHTIEISQIKSKLRYLPA